MKDGFIKTAAVTPSLRVADCKYNADEIIKNIQTAARSGAVVIAFPELSVTGYTCSDLFCSNLCSKAVKLRREG